jgi:hypothetical protein
MSKTPAASSVPQKHHYIRTIFAALFGMLALNLVLASILIVWLNRTLTDTSTYVETVAPLVTKPEVQNFVADKATDALLKDAPANDLAKLLLPGVDMSAKTPEQVKEMVRPVVRENVMQVISSPSFANTWRSTNETAHKQLMQQLKTDSDQLTLNLHPLIVSVIEELKTTKLGQAGGELSKIDIKDDVGVLNVKGGGIDKAHQYYDLFQKATVAIVAATLLAIGLCVWISVHHLKTLRRIVLGTGLTAFAVALLVQAPTIVKIGNGDPALQKASIAIAGTLFHDLQLTCIIIGVICLAIAIGSKVYAVTQSRAKR